MIYSGTGHLFYDDVSSYLFILLSILHILLFWYWLFFSILSSIYVIICYRPFPYFALDIFFSLLMTGFNGRFLCIHFLNHWKVIISKNIKAIQVVIFASKGHYNIFVFDINMGKILSPRQGTVKDLQIKLEWEVRNFSASPNAFYHLPGFYP